MGIIKVTVLGFQTSVATTFFESPKISIFNSLKMWSAIPGKKGTELRDELGRNVLIVKETPEEIYELVNKSE